MDHEYFDIIIIGAGPSGCSCAYQLAGKELKIAILEKDTFPRDKICGDALSADVVNQLFRIDPNLGQKFLKSVPKQSSYGVRFYSPNHQCLDIDFVNPNHKEAPGFIAKRKDFDTFYFNQIINLPGIHPFQDHKVVDIKYQEHEVIVKTDKKSFSGKMVIGADGTNSIVNRNLAKNKIEKDHYCAGVRQYFEHVDGFHEQNYIELHFYKDVLPGYFWIFPLPNSQANVGLGMLSSEISKQRIDLKEKLSEIIKHHPNVKHRFKNARALESIKGFGLPIGSKKRPCSGNRYLLLGDAAGLIDPFTGEGIGNAIRSGRIAGNHALYAFQQNEFDANFNKLYDREIYAKMWNELRISRSLQKLLHYPKIFNYIIHKANRNESVRMLLTSMLDNIDIKKNLLKPSFYIHLIFN
jgi:geranylgeranyl reductase family protein